jgi:hypothetical protein
VAPSNKGDSTRPYARTGCIVNRAQAEDAAELRMALMAPGRALAARVERMRAEGRGEPFQDLSLAELLRLAVAAARVFAPLAHAERAALGMGEGQGVDAVPPEIQRKTTAELVEYLTGRTEARRGPPYPGDLTASFR